MMKKKLLAVGLATIIGAATFVGCDEIPQDSDQKAQNQQEQMLQEAGKQLGMPNMTNFQEKKLMKQIMELCDKSNLICYVYSFSEMSGRYHYIGKCVGFGLPYGTEYTSPQKIEHPYSGVYYTMPQADPNGLFKPADVQATWICMINEKTGSKYILYNEPNISITSEKMPADALDVVPANYDSK